MLGHVGGGVVCQVSIFACRPLRVVPDEVFHLYVYVSVHFCRSGKKEKSILENVNFKNGTRLFRQFNFSGPTVFVNKEDRTT